jgi:hypothetical protein
VQGAGPGHSLLSPRLVILLIAYTGCDLKLQDLLLSARLLVHTKVVVLQARNVMLRYLCKGGWVSEIDWRTSEIHN